MLNFQRPECEQNFEDILDVQIGEESDWRKDARLSNHSFWRNSLRRVVPCVIILSVKRRFMGIDGRACKARESGESRVSGLHPLQLQRCVGCGDEREQVSEQVGHSDMYTTLFDKFPTGIFGMLVAFVT